MKKAPSPAEWQVLLALWRLGEQATVDEVIQELGQNPPPKRQTTDTLLTRLVEKGFVRSKIKAERGKEPRKRGRPTSRYYWAAKKREDATRDEIRRFVSVYLGDDEEAKALLKEAVKEKHSGSPKKPRRKR